MQVEQHLIDNNEWPQSLADLGYSTETLPADSGRFVSTYGVYEGGVVGIEVQVGSSSGYVVFEPYVQEDAIQWACYGQDLPEKYLPMTCRE